MQMKFELKFLSEIQTCIEGTVDKVRALFTLCVCGLCVGVCYSTGLGVKRPDYTKL